GSLGPGSVRARRAAVQADPVAPRPPPYTRVGSPALRALAEIPNLGRRRRGSPSRTSVSGRACPCPRARPRTAVRGGESRQADRRDEAGNPARAPERRTRSPRQDALAPPH